MHHLKEIINHRLLILSAILILPVLPVFAATDFSKYHSYAEMTRILKDTVKSHSKTAKLHSLGKTGQGRDIWLVEIADPQGTPSKDRPALFIGANFEGDQLIGSELALYTIDYLLANAQSSAEVKQSLEQHVFYIMPRVNPDGAEEMFAPVKTGRRTNFSARDDDNDGRVDEDGPEDINKDGFITLLRVKQPDGEYMIDPMEPRLLKKADPKKGEAGVYKLYWEGIDNDKDGFINEDPLGGVDSNRNFMHAYPYYKPEAGPHMISEPETLAIMDWVLNHRNIALFFTFGASDNLVTPPSPQERPVQPKEIDLFRFADAGNAEAAKVGIMSPPLPFFGRGMRMMEMGEFSPEMLSQLMGRSSAAPAQQLTETGRMRRPERQAPSTVNSDDIDIFKLISDKYIELTGIKQNLTVRQAQGAFFQYGYFQFGVPSFSTPGWGLNVPDQSGSLRSEMMPGARPASKGMQDPAASNRTRSAGSNAPGATTGSSNENPQLLVPGVDKQVLKWLDNEKIDGFIPWQSFRHPDLGEVEIGGFKPYVLTNPPAAQIPELGATHAKFAVHLASLFPKIKIDRPEVSDLSGGLYQIKAEVKNTGFLPTALAHAVTAMAVKPTMVQLEVAPEAILTGNAKTNFIAALSGSGGREKFSWIIKGKAGDQVVLRAVSQTGGTDHITLELK